MSFKPEHPGWSDQNDRTQPPRYTPPTTGAPTASPTTSEGRRPRWPWVLAAVTAIILSLVSLLGVVFLLDHRSEQAAAEAAKRDAARERAAEAKAIDTCREQIGEFVEGVLDVSSRAEVGITQADLAKAVADAAVLGNRVDTGALSSACDSAYRAADEALTTYALSASTWNDCIWDNGCDPDVDFDNSDWFTAQETAQEAYDAMRAGRSVDAVDG